MLGYTKLCVCINFIFIILHKFIHHSNTKWNPNTFDDTSTGTQNRVCTPVPKTGGMFFSFNICSRPFFGELLRAKTPIIRLCPPEK